MLLGKVAGHRGSSGELTIRVRSGQADRWTGLSRVLLGPPGREPGRGYDVEGSRAYRDRLVLKLRQVETATEAGNLRGLAAWAPEEEVPELPEGTFYQARLIGLEVREAGTERLLGRVEDVIETGGPPLLRVSKGREGEFLVPIAPDIVRRVDERRGRIEVQLPEGLEDLNRREEVEG